jgi:hypothetical protein
VNTDYSKERQALQSWLDEYKPLLCLWSSDEAFVEIWERLGEMVLPPAYVWVNYDDGDGECFLTCLGSAPPADKVTYMGMFICEKPFTEENGVYMLTDVDEPCGSCDEGYDSSTVEECEVCGGTGVSWVELLDVQGINKSLDFLDTWKR